jgi:hypothetical protein
LRGDVASFETMAKLILHYSTVGIRGIRLRLWPEDLEQISVGLRAEDTDIVADKVKVGALKVHATVAKPTVGPVGAPHDQVIRFTEGQYAAELVEASNFLRAPSKNEPLTDVHAVEVMVSERAKAFAKTDIERPVVPRRRRQSPVPIADEQVKAGAARSLLKRTENGIRIDRGQDLAQVHPHDFDFDDQVILAKHYYPPVD